MKHLFLTLILGATWMASPAVFAQSENNILNETTEGIEISVSMDDVPGPATVWLNFEIRNTTSEVISFPYRYYWDYPVGMKGLLTRKNGKSLTRFGTRHILADEVLDEDYDNYRVDLKPGGKLEGTVNLLDMIILQGQHGAARLKPGKYRVGLSFFGNNSNMLDITIPRQ